MPRSGDPYDENDQRLSQALNEIYKQYGHRVSITKKAKSLRKFGERTTVGTGTEVVATAIGSNTSYPSITTNGVISVVSSSGSDTMNVVIYEGHTISDGDLTFSIDNSVFALTGQTAVTLPTAMRDVTRARLSAPAVGTIYFYQGGAITNGVPDDLTTVHAVIPPGDIQTQKTQTAISSTDYWIITGATGSVLEKTGAWAQFRIEIKPVTDTYFYPLTQWIGCSDSSGISHLFGPNDPFHIVPPNHDVRVVASANAANVDTSAGMTGFLAEVL